MKKSQLQNIVRQEIKKVLREESGKETEARKVGDTVTLMGNAIQQGAEGIDFSWPIQITKEQMKSMLEGCIKAFNNKAKIIKDITPTEERKLPFMRCYIVKFDNSDVQIPVAECFIKG